MSEELAWIERHAYDGDGDEVYECPNCDFTLQLIEGTPLQNEFYFCPKCGYDMRKDKEN